MENKKSQKLYLWFVGLLAICNVALIATIWLKPTQQPFAPADHIRPGDLNKELQLTDEQKKQFQELRLQNQRKIDSLKMAATTAREVFFSKLKSEQSKQADIDSLGTIIGNYHKAIELQTYSHFSRLRTLLTDSQKTEFDKIILDVLHRLPEQPRVRHKGNMPPPPPPGEGPPDGPPMGPPEGE